MYAPLLGLQRGTVDDERDMVEAFGQFAVGCAHLLAVVTQKHKQRVGKPWFARSGCHEVADAAVGIAHNLSFGFQTGCLESLRHHIGRVVADGEQRGQERTAFARMAAHHGQGILKQISVRYAKMVDHLIGRVILLGINLLVAVGAQEGIHVVVLAFVRHEEHRGVTLFPQHRGKPRIVRHDAALHGVAEHDGRKTVERGIQAVVGVDTRRITVGKSHRAVEERVKARCQVVFVAEAAHQAGRHRFHKNDHHVQLLGLSCRPYLAGNRRYALDARPLQPLLRQAHRLVGRHQAERAVLRPQFIECAVEQVEHRVHPEIVQHGMVAEVGGTHLDGIIA